MAELLERYGARAEANRQRQRSEPALDAFRWLLEEFKVALFAQELKTPFPVSRKRLEKAWAELCRG
jgi:ATP-dependent helicase HrpA